MKIGDKVVVLSSGMDTSDTPAFIGFIIGIDYLFYKPIYRIQTNSLYNSTFDKWHDLSLIIHALSYRVKPLNYLKEYEGRRQNSCC